MGATACTTPSTRSSPPQPVGLLGVEWVLNDASIATLVSRMPANLRIDLTFAEDQSSGSSGCDTYGATF